MRFRSVRAGLVDQQGYFLYPELGAWALCWVFTELRDALWNPPPPPLSLVETPRNPAQPWLGPHLGPLLRLLVQYLLVLRRPRHVLGL